ncbi:hypothetical protein M758_UG339300 [Ceratodon purpureus]|nr:hypothetical protein M758_UG339300 [Ceratodon purpureus]
MAASAATCGNVRKVFSLWKVKMHNLQAAASPGSKVLPVVFLQERCLCHVWKTSLRHKAVQAKQCLTCEYELLQIDVKVPLCWSFMSFIVLTTNGGEDRHTVCSYGVFVVEVLCWGVH